MKRFPVQVGSVTRALIEKFGLKGAPGFELTSEIVPVAMVAALTEASTSRWAVGQIDTFTAVLPSGAVQLFNPVDSGMLVKVWGFGLSVNGSSVVDLLYPVTGPETTESSLKNFMDSRFQGEPVAQPRFAVTSVVVANQVQSYFSNASPTLAEGVPQLLKTPFVLKEATGLELKINANIQVTFANFIWEEIPLSAEKAVLGGAG